MSPLVSVIIPCYNGARWLHTAIQSVMRQSHRRLEILIFDDGSEDASAAILERLASNDSRIKVFTGDSNGGIVNALNVLLRASGGEYIARMDTDDVSLPNRIERQLAYLENAKLDLCGSWFVEIGQGISRTVRWPYETEAVHASLLFQNPILHPAILARRQVFANFAYRKSHELAEDYDLFRRLSCQYRLGNIPEALLRYRRHSCQATQARKGRMEAITRSIRIDALRQQGFSPSREEERLHNLIRGPLSIRCIDDLSGIETWLLKLHSSYRTDTARRLIASQWVRACIRGAPLRHEMWSRFRSSLLHGYASVGRKTDLDIFLLSRAGLDYSGQAFKSLRRFGLSA